MWLPLLLSLAVASASSDRAALADAVRLYYDGGQSAAAVAFETLHAERPFDDDVAWWVARSRIDQGRLPEARSALAGRTGRHLPGWKFQVLDATALVLLGEPQAALALFEHAWPQVGNTADRAAVASALGLLRAQQGLDTEAVEVLRLAGPDPGLALDPVLRHALVEAAVFEVHGGGGGKLDVVRPDGPWRLDLATGLARRGPLDDPPGPSVWGRAGSPRGRPDACVGTSNSWVWSSPQEALFRDLPGVYRAVGGQVDQLALTPPGAVDLSPVCLGDRVWFVRRLGDHAEVLRLEERSISQVETKGGAVATVDVRRGRGGRAELVLGMVVDGEPGVYWIPAGETEPQRLLAGGEPLLAPRWVD